MMPSTLGFASARQIARHDRGCELVALIGVHPAVTALTAQRGGTWNTRAVPNRWTGVTVDCAEPGRLARFWAELLQRRVSGEHDGPGWVTVGSRRDPQPRLTFQRVPEPRTTKVRIHIDVQVDDIAAGRAQVESLGGRWSGRRFDYPGEGVVLVMHDPEDNEFCLVQYYD